MTVYQIRLLALQPKYKQTMKLDDYFEFVKANCSTSQRPFQDQVTHASMGLSGEAGEVLEWHKKKIFHGRNMTQEALVEELGDVFYYYARLLNLYGVSLDEVLEKNVVKINNRKATRTGAWENK